MGAKTHKPSLTRDPADWATDHGWISRRRAINIRHSLEEIASDITAESLAGQVDPAHWAREIRKAAATIAPDMTPAQRAERKVRT